MCFKKVYIKYLYIYVHIYIHIHTRIYICIYIYIQECIPRLAPYQPKNLADHTSHSGRLNLNVYSRGAMINDMAYPMTSRHGMALTAVKTYRWAGVGRTCNSWPGNRD